MTILVILGFVAFASFAVFGLIDAAYKLRKIGEEHEALLLKIARERDEEVRQRMQYLAGIQTGPVTLVKVPDVVEKEVLSELMEETAVALELDLAAKAEANYKKKPKNKDQVDKIYEVLNEVVTEQEKKTSKQYTKR